MAPKVPACAEARVAEAEVRICVRLSALPQLRGHLKHAPSDFVVNELRGRDGSEVVLSAGAAEVHSSSAMTRRDKRARVEESDEAQAHVRFTLHKIRRGTLDALVQLADHLRIPQRNFSVCGIKDAFAVTTQEVVARGASVEALRALKLHDMIIGDARVTDGPLRVGGAAGNRFTIRVRGMSVPQPQLERAAAALRAHGFVNYYGLQRFGTAHVKSFELGRRLLRRDYAGLLEAIVCVPTATGSSMPAEEREARDHFALTHDAGAALRRFPRRLRLERELLARLRRAELKEERGGWEARCRAAILSLPLSKRKLWANAYYSLVFNLCATERIARFGARPVVGDLVLAGAARSTTHHAAEARSTGAQPRVVSREDVEGGIYSIGDVVLPLMGAWVETPANEIGLLCRSYIAYDGIEHHTLEVRNSECAAARPRLAGGSGAQHGGAQAGGCAGGGRAAWRGRCDGYVDVQGGEEGAFVLPEDACAEAEAAEVEARASPERPRVRAGQDADVLEEAQAGADCTAAYAGSLLAAGGHGSPLADGLDECEDGEDDCPGGPAWNGEYELRGSYRCGLDRASAAVAPGCSSLPLCCSRSPAAQ